MTNAEYYLKEEADTTQLADELYHTFNDIENKFPYVKGMIMDFFNFKRQPTLTEDERAILRYVDNRYTHIERNDGLFLIDYETEHLPIQLSFEMYSHLFQFIKNGEEYSIEELLKGE